MKSKITSAFFLIIIGQSNIFWQNKEIFFYKAQKFENISKKQVRNDKFLSLPLKKQSVPKMREKSLSLLEIAKNWQPKVTEILFVDKKIVFESNSKRLSTFYFNSIKPNWFGCCLATT